MDATLINLDSPTYFDAIGNAIYDDRIYISGVSEKNNEIQDFGTILQIDAATLTLSQVINLDRGALENTCSTVVEQSDGSIVTTNKYWNGQFGTDSDSGVQVVKLSPEGTILDTFDFREATAAQRLGITANDDIIFPTTRKITPGFAVGDHWLNRMAADSLSNIRWGTQLPQDIIRSRRVYITLDVFTANNGDIILAGQTQDQETVEENCFIQHGFLARFTDAGEPLWVRVYRVPKPDDQGGSERCSRGRLNLVRETPSGGLVAVGSIFNVNFDFGEPRNTVEASWILSVDANGCLDGYSCQGLITLSEGVDTTRPSIFSPAYEWTQETIVPVLGFSNRTLRYRFSQASERNDEYFYYQVRVSDEPTGEDNFVPVDQYMREFEDRVYVFVDELEGPGMRAEFDAGVPVYDFSLEVGDTFRTVRALAPGFHPDRLDEFRVAYVVTDRDSVTLLNGERRCRWRLVTAGQTDQTHEWIEGLGDPRGLRVPVGDPATLRCHSLYGETLYRTTQAAEACWVEEEIAFTVPRLVDTIQEWWHIIGINPMDGTDLGSGRLRFSRDTFQFDGRSYRRLELSQEQFGGEESFGPYYYVTFDSIYLRQEGSRVYQYNPRLTDGRTEALLYDFGLELEEQVTLTNYSGMTCSYNVVQVDTITLYDGSPRRRLGLRRTDVSGDFINYYWIDGIGEQNGLITTFVFACSEGLEDLAPPYLLCYFENGSQQFRNPAVGPQYNCWQTVSVAALDPLPELIVYPNPATDRLTLRGVRPATVRLYDLSGRQVAAFGAVNELPLDDFPPGMYLLRITTADGRTGVRRIVRQ